MFEGPLLAPLNEGANRSRRGVENVDTMPLDNIPEPIRLRIVWCAFVHQHGGAVRKWTVDHIAVTGYPTDVRSAPVNVFVFDVEDPFRGQMSLQKITCGCVQNAFWFSCRSGGIKNVERMFTV